MGPAVERRSGLFSSSFPPLPRREARVGEELPRKVRAVGEADAAGDLRRLEVGTLQEHPLRFLETEPVPPSTEVHAHPLLEIAV